MPVNDYHTVIYKDDDGWVIAEDKWGGELAESLTAPETVFQTAFDRAGACKIHDSTYDFSAAFAGLKYKSELCIYASYNTFLRVPQGYTGGCIVFDPTYNAGTIRNTDLIGGLSIQEQGTPATLYSGIKYDGNMVGQGLTFGEFGNVHVFHANKAIELDFVASESWMTTFKFKQIKAYYTKILCDVVNTSNQSPLGFSTMHFDFIGIQSHTNTSHGFRGLRGNNNLYTNCAVWDVQNSTVPGGVVSAQFMADATNQYVLGGIMMHANVDNQAAPGQVRWIDGHGPAPVWDILKQQIAVTAPVDGSKVINIPHGMGLAPDWAIVAPISKDANTSPFRVTSKTTTNIQITYEGAPPIASTAGNQNNLVYEVWTSVK